MWADSGNSDPGLCAVPGGSGRTQRVSKSPNLILLQIPGTSTAIFSIQRKDNISVCGTESSS